MRVLINMQEVKNSMNALKNRIDEITREIFKMVECMWCNGYERYAAWGLKV